MTAVVFIDIDGPLLPGRFYAIDLDREQLPFDPAAVAMFNKLVEGADAQIVISSAWARLGRVAVEEILEKHGIKMAPLHDDWTCYERGMGRAVSIGRWLVKHPEITNYVAIDDDEDIKTLVGGVHCAFKDGFLFDQYEVARRCLGLERELSAEPPRSPSPLDRGKYNVQNA